MLPTAKPPLLGYWFQSAPADEGGRCLLAIFLPERAKCFNPRPPMKAGDAVGEIPADHHVEVSIRARR